VAMLALATLELGFGRVSRLELEREGPSFTIDTVRALPAELGLPDDVPIALVLGADNLRGLPSWRGVEELLERVDPVVVARRGDVARVTDLAGRLSDAALAKLERGFLDLPTVDVEATDLRARLAAGEHCDDELPAGVGEYIREHGVYGSEAAR